MRCSGILDLPGQVSRVVSMMVLLSAFLLLPINPVSAQLSPGKLAESHAHLEGLSNCTKCHVLGEKVSNDKCLDCHKEIDIRIKEQRGYHSSVPVKGRECVKCHSDHHGRNFNMIHFETEKFDHSLTGYNLEGAHAEKSCADCHKSEFIKEPKIRQRKFTYMGLDSECLTCHTDEHQGTLSPDCASCHDSRAFKPASKFDHSKTRFRLRGQHASKDCQKCHKVKVSKGVEMQEFAGIPFENCTSCHEDVHQNKFGQNCVQCHSEESFKRIKQLNDFNHSLTSYPLEGKHQYVSCRKCHKSQYTKAIKYNYCSDCHTDFHENQFSRKGGSPDCSACHSTTGFERSDYTVERHNESAFELNGAHLATPCFACHKKSGKWKFREIGNTCADCHADTHEHFMDKKYYGQESCASCHNNEKWSRVDFDHSLTNYRLEGAHLEQSCRSCHYRKGMDGILHQEFSQLTSDCVNCHRDVHAGQFGKPDESLCLQCHDYNNWTASRFDHNQAAFKLDGKHKEVACIKCHKPTLKSVEGINAETGEGRDSQVVSYVLFKLKDYSCEACH